MNIVDAKNIGSGLKATLLNLGFSDTVADYFVDFAYLFIVLFASVVVYYIAKFIIQHILKRLIERSKSKWDDYLLEYRVFTRLALLLPPFVLQVSIHTATSRFPEVVHYISMGLNIYITCILLLVVVSFLNVVNRIYSDMDISGSKPIKGYLQIIKIIVYAVAAISVISMLLGQSLLTLLAGLGAISAVLILIFKDSILGLVAGVQISSNHLLAIGDWITMPKYSSDGTVIDISLVTVKVRNFDNSISAIPTYSLITDSFQNWRDMNEAGGRRLKRVFFVDINTICFINPEIIEKLNKRGIKVDQIPAGKEVKTNLGLFRYYILDRLRQMAVINSNSSLMVRMLEPKESGLPIEIYAFYTSPEWTNFENFQTALFEEIYAILPDFGLKAFQRPSGWDFHRSNVLTE